jgi:hypothetical protein
MSQPAFGWRKFVKVLGAALAAGAIGLLGLAVAAAAAVPPQVKAALAEGEPPPQSFEVIHKADGLFRARITVAPKFELAGETIKILLGDSRVTKKVLEQHDPGFSFVGVMKREAWLMTLAEITYPYQRVTKVRAVFDKGSAESTAGGASTYELAIPTGATHLVNLEVTFVWQANQKTLVFASHTQGMSRTSTMSGTAPGAEDGERP